MHDPEKSEAPILAMKLANKADGAAAESVERRGTTKGNALQTTTCRTQSRESVSPGLDRVRDLARRDRKTRFTALLHHVTIGRLRASYFALKRDAAPGVDGMTWREYGVELEPRLAELHARIHRGAYRARPSRRRMIPKPDGRERPLGIASLEDKIVQCAVVEILNAIYEPMFVGYSYGFRPGRSQHDALDALAYAIGHTAVNWVLDVDVQAFFDTVDHEWLMRFLEYRIGDRRLLRLIRKWLKAGVMADGSLLVTTTGTPQGAVVSPVLANVYMHFVFDLWANQWRKRRARGNIIIVRYADDIVVGFERRDDAQAFLVELRERLGRFSLLLHPEKTRLIEFGRYAAERRARRGEGKPETFSFLGFTHICGVSRSGRFLLTRKTRRDRMQSALRYIKEKLRERLNESVAAQSRWLNRVMRGYFAYHAVPTNLRTLTAFRYLVTLRWLRTLRRRGQTRIMTWERFNRVAAKWLPPVRVLHPWPDQRFCVKHPR
jgi:RNA-directed DNA polymerase